MKYRFPVIGFLTTLAVFLVTGAQGAEYEKPPKVKAAEFFSAVDLKTDLYKVESKVPTDGFLTRARIDSDYGDFTAVGPGMLAIRVNEIEALAKLEELEESDEFQNAMKDTATEKKDGLEQIIDQPKETLEGVAEGVGRFFKRTARSAKTGFQTAGDAAKEQQPGVQAGPGANLPGKALDPQAVDDESKLSKAARASKDVALNVLGFDDARRQLCKRMEVDPYTTNPVLDQKLDEVTQSLFAGNLAVDFATALIPGGSLINTSNMVGNWVWDTPPGDLRVRIEKELRGIGVTQQDIDSLLRHKWFPLSYQVTFANAMVALDGVSGRPDIMPLALSVTTYDQARFLIQSLRMTAGYHQTVAPLASLQLAGTVIGLQEDGQPVIATAVNYLSWTEELDQFSGGEVFADKTPEVYFAGSVSDRARENLTARGWTLIENSELFDYVPGS